MQCELQHACDKRILQAGVLVVERALDVIIVRRTKKICFKESSWFLLAFRASARDCVNRVPVILHPGWVVELVLEVCALHQQTIE